MQFWCFKFPLNFWFEVPSPWESVKFHVRLVNKIFRVWNYGLGVRIEWWEPWSLESRYVISTFHINRYEIDRGEDIKKKVDVGQTGRAFILKQTWVIMCNYFLYKLNCEKLRMSSWKGLNFDQKRWKCLSQKAINGVT